MKHRRIKFVISFFYWIVLLLKRICLKLLGKEPAGKCTVIYFHSVKDGERDKFIRQMNVLKKNALPLRADYTGRLQNGKNCVIVTFDDGFKSIIKNALPELQKLEIPCAIFFPVKYLGQRPEWECNKRFHDGDEEIMTSRDLKDLPVELVKIGSHSFSHSMMTKLDPPAVKVEFIRSKEILESISGAEVNLFSFPYGDVNNELTQQALAAGYKRTFTSSYEVVKSEMNKSVIGRVRTDPSDNLLEFKLKIMGAYKWMIYLRFLKEKFLNLRGKTEEVKETKVSPLETSLPGVKEL
ncbi:MAG: polysaccharide deacetylase family protein [Syntrophomonadaceae bacterium]